MIFYELSRQVGFFINELFEPPVILDEAALFTELSALKIRDKENLFLLLNSKTSFVLRKSDEEHLLELEQVIKKTFHERRFKYLPSPLSQIIKKMHALRMPHRHALLATIEESTDLKGTKKERLKKIIQQAIFTKLCSYYENEKVSSLFRCYADHLNEVEYQKLFIYCSIAKEFENKGVAEEHAIKLCILFGNAKKAIEALDNYGKQNTRGFNGRRQNKEGDYIYQACLFSLPDRIPKYWLKWRELFQDISNFSDITFREMLSYTQEIEDFYSQIDDEEFISPCKRTLNDYRYDLQALRADIYKTKTHRVLNPIDADHRNNQLILKNKQLDLFLQLYAIVCKKEQIPFPELDKDAVHGIYNRYLTTFSQSYSFLVRQGFNQSLINNFLSLDRSRAGKEIPALYIEHERYPDYYLRKLEVMHDDLDAAKAACLGNLSNSCQNMGDVGHDCAIHGLTSPLGGFYVLCRKLNTQENFFEEEIIAQSWVWRSHDGGLVFDSIEYQSCVSEEILEVFYNRASIQLNLKEIARVYVGDCDKTPKQIGINIGLKGKPIDYSGYMDSATQRVLRHDHFPYLRILWDREDEFGRNQTTKQLKEQLSKPLSLLASNQFIRYFIQDLFKKHARLSKEILNKYCFFYHFDENEKHKFMQFILINKAFYNLLESKTPNFNEVISLFISGAVIKNLKNSSGDTLLHLTKNKKALALFWQDYYSLEERLNIIMQKNNEGETFWHFAAHQNKEIIRIFFESFSEDHWLSLLIDNEEQEGILNYIINNIPSIFMRTLKVIPQKYLLKVSVSLMQQLSYDFRLLKNTVNLLLEKISLDSIFETIDKYGNTFLHYAACRQPELLKEWIGLFRLDSQEKLLARIMQQNFDKVSVLHQAASKPESFIFLSSFFSESLLLKEMKEKNSVGNTILHTLVLSSHLVPVLDSLVKSISKSDIIKLFKEKNDAGDNVLHSAAPYFNALIIVLHFFLSHTTSEKALQTLKEKNREGDTVLHCFLGGSFKEILQILFIYLKAHEVLSLLKEKNSEGFSVIYYTIANSYEFEEIFSLLLSKIDSETIVQFITETNEREKTLLEEIIDLKWDKSRLLKICYKLFPSLTHELAFLKTENTPSVRGFFSEVSEITNEESLPRISIEI